eukprot:199800-Pleurochrysis_carterae.AAC.1
MSDEASSAGESGGVSILKQVETEAGDGRYTYSELMAMVRGKYPHFDDLMLVACVDDYLRAAKKEERERKNGGEE